jgi:hypothetical protein
MDILSSPFTFSQDEYDESLGVYQKFILGDSTQVIDKIYCMSVFQYYDTAMQKYSQSGDYHKYCDYLYLSIKGIRKTTPDWYVRLYIDSSLLHEDNPDKDIWLSKLKLILKIPNIQIIAVKFPRYYINGHHKDLLPVMFRYLALFDENLSVILFRDVDNIYTSQHQYFVDKWLEQGDKDICVYMNNKYTRQQISDLVPESGNSTVVLEDKHYNIIFGGLWNIKKAHGFSFSKTLWQKLFAYCESYTSFTSDYKYIDSDKYGIKFMYGFDELALSRVAVPIFISMGLNFYAIPIKIYDTTVFKTMFQDPTIKKFLLKLSDRPTLKRIEEIVINEYWVMTADTAGLAQYVLAILSNIYFGILMGKSPYLDSSLINNIKTRIMPNVLMMGIGVFTFKNFKKFRWFPDGTTKRLSGSEIVDKFLETGERLTLSELTAGMDPSLPPPPIEDPPPDDYGI